MNLNPGKNVFTFAFDLAEVNEPVRVEVVDLPKSSARYQIIGGK